MNADRNRKTAGNNPSAGDELFRVVERAKREWERTFDAIPDLITIIDNNGRILRANRAVADAFGLPITGIPGRSCSRLFHGRDSPPDFCPHRLLLEDGREHTAEGRLAGVEGNFLITVSPFFDETGELAGAVQVARDITGEAGLKSQVRQLQKMDSLGRLAGGIAHEFGNILTSVGCDIQLLKNRLEKDHRDTGGLEEIIKSVKRATDLTRKLYEFSRPSAETPEELDCNRFLHSLEKMLRGVLRKNIELVVTPAPRPAVVRADRSRLEGALVNLVLNARDAMERGGRLSITMGIERLKKKMVGPFPGLAGGEYAVIEVRDTGRGMDDEVLSRVFEPLFTTKKEDGCLGLGLPVVYGNIRRAGGAVTVESQPGKGTSFRIYLPLVE